MDEKRQTSGDGDRHNGIGRSATGWAGSARVPPPRSGTGAAVQPPSTDDWPAPVGADSSPTHAFAEQHVPGLDDDTPLGGVPAVEPPLWREAARHAASAPPAPPEAAGSAVPSAWVERSSWAEEPTWQPEAAAEEAGVDLPQRIPSEPDVPELHEPAGETAPAEAPQLVRIADQLRRDDVPAEDAPTDGFDVDAVLDAVRDVAGVRAATLRANAGGAHTLRLDLADDADPVQVSRVVARLLQERMGLSAAPRHVPGVGDDPLVAPAPAADPEVAADPVAVTSPLAAPASAAPAPPSGEAVGRAPVEPSADDAPRAGPPSPPSGRVVIDHVEVSVEGLDARVEVRLAAGHRRALGLASGPAIDSYLVRLAAMSAAKAIDQLMHDEYVPPPRDSASRCFVEHTSVVPFGTTEVAVVVVLLVSDGSVEQLAGSAVVDGDARHAAVRATLWAVNRRLDAILAR